MPGGVRRGKDEQALVGGLHAVELREKLVDEMPARGVPHVGAAGAEGVDFVEE